jgi:hypothetical protein
VWSFGTWILASSFGDLPSPETCCLQLQAPGFLSLLWCKTHGRQCAYPLRYLFATNPAVMSQALTIVHYVISTFLIKRARITVKSGAQSGTVTLIQRFGSALNLNPHFHMLYLNGVYDSNG